MDGGILTSPPPRFSGPRFSRPGFNFRGYHGGPSMPGQGLLANYDGKKLRTKPIIRKTVDYNCIAINYIQNRIWQRDHRDIHVIQPDALYFPKMLPPHGMLDQPMNCVVTKHVRTAANKIRCPIFCLCWTPEGRRLITGASSGEFTLWNGLTFSFETILQAHDTSVRGMTWSHNEQWMLTGDHGGFVKYWQMNMNNVKMYQAHKDPIRGLRLVHNTMALVAKSGWIAMKTSCQVVLLLIIFFLWIYLHRFQYYVICLWTQLIHEEIIDVYSTKEK